MAGVDLVDEREDVFLNAPGMGLLAGDELVLGFGPLLDGVLKLALGLVFESVFDVGPVAGLPRMAG